jgi:hypothetical protein
MSHIIVSGIAFLFGFCATYAGTKSLIAVERRQPFRTANWGLVVNGLNWSVIILVVLASNLPAILADLLGCYLADYLVVHHQKKKETRSEDHRASSSAGG